MNSTLMPFCEIEKMLLSANMAIHSEERKLQLMYIYMGIATDGSSKIIESPANFTGGFSTEIVDCETIEMLKAF